MIVVGDLGAPNPTTGSVTLGSTEPDGSRITFNNNSAVTFVPALPGGNSLLGVAAHEIGHAIGILHSTTPGTLMFPFSSVTETLASEDISAVRALYGWIRRLDRETGQGIEGETREKDFGGGLAGGKGETQLRATKAEAKGGDMCWACALKKS